MPKILLAVANPRLLVIALVALVAALCACDVHHDEPIEECVQYAAKVRACFGERAGAHAMQSFAKPPPEETARTILAARCAANNAQVSRGCR